MASKKAGGSTKNGRDSNPKYRGVKAYGGETVKAGNIIVRQVGTKFHPGANVYRGKDFSLHAKIEGRVEFEFISRDRQCVSVYPIDANA